MAAVVTETKVAQMNGGPSMIVRVCGTAVLNGGTNQFIIQPGNNDVNITTPVTSRGARDIIAIGVSCSSAANATMIEVQRGYNTTADAIGYQVTCTADESYDWWVDAFYAGQ